MDSTGEPINRVRGGELLQTQAPIGHKCFNERLNKLMIQTLDSPVSIEIRMIMLWRAVYFLCMVNR